MTIQFSINEASHVKLTIDNSYDTRVATLVDGNLPAGAHQILWTMDNQLSGIYFYTIEAKGINSAYYFKTTHRMILMK